MPHSDLWSAPPGQPRGEAAARASLVCSKRSFRLPRVPAGRWSLAHAEAPGVPRPSSCRLCTRGIRRCAQTDKCGATRPVSCPTLHTHGRPVCTSGQERCDTANLVSDFARVRAPRVHKRTRNRPNRPPRVRLRTRPGAPCAQTDKSGTILPVTCPTSHTPICGVCTNGCVNGCRLEYASHWNENPCSSPV